MRLDEQSSFVRRSRCTKEDRLRAVAAQRTIELKYSIS